MSLRARIERLEARQPSRPDPPRDFSAEPGPDAEALEAWSNHYRQLRAVMDEGRLDEAAAMINDRGGLPALTTRNQVIYQPVAVRDGRLTTESKTLEQPQ